MDPKQSRAICGLAAALIIRFLLLGKIKQIRCIAMQRSCGHLEILTGFAA